jgi:hypothetical protein
LAGPNFLSQKRPSQAGRTISSNRIKAEGWRPEDDDGYMIEGSDTYREEDLFRGIGSWLRKLGWESTIKRHRNPDHHERDNQKHAGHMVLNVKVSDGWPSRHSRIAKQRGEPAIRSTVLLN